MPREIDFTPVDPETIERFTCFHDKNDHEIYEGNICTRKVQQSDYYPADVYAPEHPETKRWVEVQKGIITMQPEVRFNNEFICHKLWKEEELEPRQAVSAWDYEIIGDIHDNPEIMTLNAY
jgi:hypothetical protein